MLTQAVVFLLDTFLGLFVAALLVRFYLQVVRAPARNQISQFIAALTDWVVRPARKVIPGWAGLDLSTLVLAWLVQFLLLVLTRLLLVSFAGDVPILGLAVVAVISLVRTSLYILMGALIVQAVLSWVAPQSAIGPVVNALTRPFLRPIQRRVPLVGNVDLSPLLLLVALQLVVQLVLPWFGGALLGLFGG
jgi:YggT family protein